MGLEKQNIIIYDGECSLCSGSVRFVKKRAMPGQFEYFSSQSSIGKDILTMFGYAGKKLDTVLFIENCNPFERSTASLRILKELGWPWKIFYALIIVPPPIRDAVYKLIAHYRYRVFGRKSCDVELT